MLLIVYFSFLLLKFESCSTRYRYLLAFCSSDNKANELSYQVYGSMNIFFNPYGDQDREKNMLHAKKVKQTSLLRRSLTKLGNRKICFRWTEQYFYCFTLWKTFPFVFKSASQFQNKKCSLEMKVDKFGFFFPWKLWRKKNFKKYFDIFNILSHVFLAKNYSLDLKYQFHREFYSFKTLHSGKNSAPWTNTCPVPLKLPLLS